jgi:hypothetical protein
MNERPQYVLAEIKDFNDALDRCWKHSGKPAKEIAARLEIGYGHFTRMLNPDDPLHFPPEKIVPLMIECGNLLPLEWLAWQMGYALHDLSLGAILAAIRDALVDGKAPRFHLEGIEITASGRIDWIGGKS